MMRTYRTLNDYEMQHNAEVGLFTRPSSLKTVYINIEDIHEGILAHEMGHHIIDHFLKVRHPATTAEIMTRYIDDHLYR